MAVNLMQYQQRLEWLKHITAEELAAEIIKSGFNCVRCGHCCTSLKVDANDSELGQAEEMWGNVALDDKKTTDGASTTPIDFTLTRRRSNASWTPPA